MLSRSLWLLGLACFRASAQSSSTADDSTSTTSASSSTSTASSSSEYMFTFSFTNSFSVLTTNIPSPVISGSDLSYLSPTGQSTISTRTETITHDGIVSTITTTETASVHNSQITLSSSSISLTLIGGSTSTANATNSTASSTSSSALPTNTLPCNGYPEFCSRKFSNISQVVAHNAAFVVKNNAASNQELPITTQLEDGIRMLSGEVHWENNTLWNCHTSCKILNAGTWEQELVTVRNWLAANPYDVLSILIVNSGLTSVENFVAPITNAGLLPYVYTPAYVPQYLDQWPTLGEMILSGKRLVFFMDYQANQTAVPYILDEFTHIWETPFSPTNQSFPCTIQRPPGLNETDARDQFMYLANHNLNTAVDLSSLGISSSTELLIPNTVELNVTNGEYDMFGQLGAMSQNCSADWGRAPNWLLVDYYNLGSSPCSVFRVAAEANNVTYRPGSCGGVTSDAPALQRSSYVGLVLALAVTLLMTL